jgi:hypothetical protein
VLHLPDMAELMREQVVTGPLEGLAEHDRVPGRVTVEAVEVRKPEEPWPHEDADPVDPHRARIEVEPVEPGLRPLERLAQVQATGWSTRIAVPSGICWNWKP